MTRRTTTTTLFSVAAGLALSSVAGCDWRVFDDLKDDLWVDTQTKPSAVPSRAYGAAIQGVPGADEGTIISVLGRTEPSLTNLEYDADGVATIVINNSGGPRELFGNTDDAFNFDASPAFVRDPNSSEVAVPFITGTVNDDTRNIKVTRIDAASFADDIAINHEPETTIPRSPISSFGPVASAAFAGDNLVIAAYGGPLDPVSFTSTEPRVYLDDFINGVVNNELTACNLPAGEAAFAVGFGEVGNYPDALGMDNPVIAGGDILVATASISQIAGPPSGNARIRVLVSTPTLIPEDCVFAEGIEIPVDLGTGVGAQLLVDAFGGTAPADNRVVLSTPGDDGKITIFDFTSGTPVEQESIGVSDLGQIAVGDLDGDGVSEVVAGQPNFDVDGVTNAGQVTVYSVGPLALAASPLHDADPTASQFFGNAVTIAPFTANGETRNILVAASDGEIFTYFRTELYDDVRAGRN
ncbi:MAG: FG-GAP repeat protein [Kofleriaceae bacterium]